MRCFDCGELVTDDGLVCACGYDLGAPDPARPWLVPPGTLPPPSGPPSPLLWRQVGPEVMLAGPRLRYGLDPDEDTGEEAGGCP